MFFLTQFFRTHLDFINVSKDISGGPVVENPLANAGDTGSIPGPGAFHILWGN